MPNKRQYLLFFILLSIQFSLMNCCSSSDRNMHETDDTKEINKQILPDVNTAEVNAEIIGFEEKAMNTQIKILKVLSYGASVPPLPIGTILSAEITSSSIENSKMSKEDLLHSGSIRKIKIMHFPVPANLQTSSWRIISIE